jgi:hypothetical protein
MTLATSFGCEHIHIEKFIQILVNKVALQTGAHMIGAIVARMSA